MLKVDDETEPAASHETAPRSVEAMRKVQETLHHEYLFHNVDSQELVYENQLGTWSAYCIL